ncbi:MAG TPA: NusG domain II-containing protein [Erysipelotrichaceae bacterium]|nr:NusG domain II-containing protein [Erysipelotrichaceae bacterium]
MNRYDKALVIFILISSVVLYGSMEWFVRASTNDKVVAVVSYREEEVLRIDMSVDNTYIVEGTLGDVFIEVKDKALRVEKETSPYHLCSIQGWVEFANVPIVCLPNHIVIMIENAEVNPDGEDSVIQ